MSYKLNNVYSNFYYIELKKVSRVNLKVINDKSLNQLLSFCAAFFLILNIFSNIFLKNCSKVTGSY